MAKKLTPKQRRFVEEYLIDLNATQAAIRAGYSEKRANAIGYDLLTKTDIENAIHAAKEKRSERTGVTADRVVKELARIAFVDTRQIFTWGPGGVNLRPSDELDDDEAAIVAEVTETRSENGGGSIKVKRFDKLKALELLGKHLGMYVDKREISGREGAPIELLDLSNRTTEELLAIVRAGEGNN
jgi:phage terminase small subunit